MSSEALDRLSHQGFLVVPGPVPATDMPRIALAYDRLAERGDVRHGSASVRINQLAKIRDFDGIFTWSLLLRAASQLIGADFRLSAFHGRSVRPGAAAQALHQDVAPGQDGWPLLGFILMLDPFTPDNGATRFVPESQRATEARAGQIVAAQGAPGTMILFDGSTWHGHGANRTSGWRRSIQGAFVPRSAASAVDHSRYADADTQLGLPPDVRWLLCV